MAEYPPLSFLIFGLYSLQNSCTAICIPYLGGHIAGLVSFSLALLSCGSKILSYPVLAEGFRGIDVKPPSVHWQSAHSGDAMSPMWLPQPINLQRKLSLLLEYFGTNQINI